MTETAIERYERLADAFYAQTGIIAPGRSQPAEMGNTNWDARYDAWRAFLKEHDKAGMAAYVPNIPLKQL